MTKKKIEKKTETKVVRNKATTSNEPQFMVITRVTDLVHGTTTVTREFVNKV